MSLPVPTDEDPKPLWEEIKRFSRKKYGWAFLLLLLALLGIVVPVIPGLLFLLLAVALFRPGLMGKIRRWMDKFWKKS